MKDFKGCHTVYGHPSGVAHLWRELMRARMVPICRGREVIVVVVQSDMQMRRVRVGERFVDN